MQLGEEVAQRGQAAEIVQLLVAVVGLEDTETVVVDIPPNAAHTAFVVGDILVGRLAVDIRLVVVDSLGHLARSREVATLVQLQQRDGLLEQLGGKIQQAYTYTTCASRLLD